MRRMSGTDPVDIVSEEEKVVLILDKYLAAIRGEKKESKKFHNQSGVQSVRSLTIANTKLHVLVALPNGNTLRTDTQWGRDSPRYTQGVAPQNIREREEGEGLRRRSMCHLLACSSGSTFMALRSAPGGGTVKCPTSPA